LAAPKNHHQPRIEEADVGSFGVRSVSSRVLPLLAKAMAWEHPM